MGESLNYDAFHPGQVWLDTKGERIQAHGGSVMYLDGTYYWYGENKEKTDGKNGIWHWGVRCYASKDLYNWEDCGIIIPPEVDDETSSLHPKSCMDRPHIIYNEKTKKFGCHSDLMVRWCISIGWIHGRSAISNSIDAVEKYVLYRE